MTSSIGDTVIQIKVSDIMSRPVITVDMHDKVDKIASLMRSKKVGSVVVLDENSNPIGVITERDLVARIVSKDKKPSSVTTKDVMSKPVQTIDPTATIVDASKTMRSIGVRRLIVVEDSKLVGVISSDDIAKVTPELITIILEEASIGRAYKTPVEAGIAGRCDSCNQWSTDLREQDGLYLCDNCHRE